MGWGYGVWCRGESRGMCMMVDNLCGLLYLTLGYCCRDAILCLWFRTEDTRRMALLENWQRDESWANFLVDSF